MTFDLNSIQKKKEKEIIILSVEDEAIDWENSDFPDVYSSEESEDEFEGIEAKKKHYANTLEISNIVFFDGKKPTCFVFKNPKIMENANAIEDLTINSLGILKKKKAEFSQISLGVWKKLFVGHFDGFPHEYNNENTRTLLQKPFSNGNLNSSFLDTIFELGILKEIAAYITNLKKS